MATATFTEDTRLFSTARGTHAGAGVGVVSNHSPRLRKARYRLLLQTALGLICNLLLWFSLSYMLGPAFVPYRPQVAALFFLLVFIPGIDRKSTRLNSS